MITIRTMRPHDIDMVNVWWSEQRMPKCPPAVYPPTSFVAEYNGVPVLSASLFLMNCKMASKIENLVGNPYKKAERREALPILFRHMEGLAKAWGYTHLILFAYKEELMPKYEDLGFSKTIENVTLFSKELGD